MNFTQLLDMILHVDKYLGQMTHEYGAMVYLVLAVIVFCETGVLVLFFLPGDTLLFIGGAFCAVGAMNAPLLAVILVASAIAGSTFNYWLGNKIGHKVFTHNYRWLDQDALRKTHAFYEKYGGITMMLSRFIPVVRTFAPFVAGVSEMTFAKFQMFNIAGAVVWSFGLVAAGYFFGGIPIVRDHLQTIVLFGAFVAFVPVSIAGAWRFLAKKLKANRA